MKDFIREQIEPALSAPPPYIEKAAEREAREVRTLTLNNSDMGKLTYYLGRNIESVDTLIAAAKSISTLNVKGLSRGEITLEPYLLERLKSRCHPTTDFPTFVREMVVKALMDYCGC